MFLTGGDGRVERWLGTLRIRTFVHKAGWGGRHINRLRAGDWKVSVR